MNEEKKAFVNKAKIAEQAERYDDMVAAMKKVTDFGEDLSKEERNLLSVAYKNVVGARRSAWRIVSKIISKDDTSELRKEVATEFLAKIKEELEKMCKEVLSLLDKNLIPRSKESDNNESMVFYLKMKGDYYRYLVEVYDSADQTKTAEEAYEKATEIAQDVEATNPIRLGLALNYSVFFYEIRQDTRKACTLAKEAFENALAELEDNDTKTDNYKDSTLIMQLLRDNLALWEAEDQDVSVGDNDENFN